MAILSFDIEEPWHTIPRDPRYEEACRPFDMRYFFDFLRTHIDLEAATPILFWVGSVAERNKQLVRELANEGCIIASHGYDHEDFASFQAAELVSRLSSAKKHLEDLLGSEVSAFRAPAFSVRDIDEFWLAEEVAGFKYDYSVCDAGHFSGGGHNSGITAPLRVPGLDIIEFPMSTTQFLGQDRYVTGGGYFRICPTNLLKTVQLSRSYNMFYLRPIDFLRPEFDSADPRSISRKLKQRVRWGNTWGKMKQSLSQGKWHRGDLTEWIQHYE